MMFDQVNGITLAS